MTIETYLDNSLEETKITAAACGHFEGSSLVSLLHEAKAAPAPVARENF